MIIRLLFSHAIIYAWDVNSLTVQVTTTGRAWVE